jgi:peptidoglycan/xylan/chitin deacetylase (PgdA/CDA1 family)
VLPGFEVAAGALLLGAGAGAWGAFHPAAQLFGPTIRRCARRDAIALTFDDGPNPAVTPRLLDLLDRYNARATFFLIGRHVRACPELAAEIAARGHVVGNHTETHPRLTWCSAQRTLNELQRCQQAVEQATSRACRWMRPPYGARGPQSAGAVRAAGLEGVVMWSVWARDWKPQPAARVIERLRCVRGGDIVLLHDGGPHELRADRAHTVAALEHWLPRWKDAGLAFIAFDHAAG